MRFSVRKRQRLSSVTLLLVYLLLLVISGFWIMEAHLKPTLLAIAEARATVIATQAINNVINETISQIIDPQQLVNVKMDNRGRVVFVQPNTMEFNKLAAETTIKVQDRLKNISDERIAIPVGQVIGSQILASLGPKIIVTVIPVGTVQVNVVDKFEQAGINQTRHMVYLVATTSIRIVVPLVSSTVSVNTRVPITEYIVVGEVPGTFVQFPNPLSSDNNGGIKQ